MEFILIIIGIMLLLRPRHYFGCGMFRPMHMHHHYIHYHNHMGGHDRMYGPGGMHGPMF